MGLWITGTIPSGGNETEILLTNNYLSTDLEIEQKERLKVPKTNGVETGVERT